MRDLRSRFLAAIVMAGPDIAMRDIDPELRTLLEAELNRLDQVAASRALTADEFRHLQVRSSVETIDVQVTYPSGPMAPTGKRKAQWKRERRGRHP